MLRQMTSLLPTTASTTVDGRTRNVELHAGEGYRVDPLNKRRKRLRGTVGILASWDMAGTVGRLRLPDGSEVEVELGDLVAQKLPIAGITRTNRTRSRSTV